MTLTAYSTDASPGFTGLDWDNHADDGNARHYAIYFLNDSSVLGAGKLRVTIEWSVTMFCLSGGVRNAKCELYSRAHNDDPTASPDFEGSGPPSTTLIPNHVFAPGETFSDSGTVVLTTLYSEPYPAPAYFDINSINTMGAVEYTDFNFHITLIEWVPDVGVPVPIYTASAAPVADFVGSPLSGPVSLSVDFTDLSTNTPTGWAWTFGDTDTATSQNPSHIYDSIGLFTVALTATNADGSDTETKVDYINVLGPPVADFSGTPTSGTVSLSVDFTDLSTNSPDTWLWDFGDGGSSTSQNPTYVYTHVGVYTVTLTASSTAGSDSETKIDYITVTDITEYGAAIVENCDLDTGGAAVGLRVSNVAIARDNILGSLTIDASAEVRMKDNAYSVLVNNGTPNQLAGDRAAFDTATYFDRHASDIDDTAFTYHNNPSNPPMSSYLGNGSIFVGNVSNVATGVTMSGDATIDNAGVLTIAAKAVTDAKTALTNGSIFIGGADGAAHEQAISGDASISNAGVLSLTTVNANVGTYGDASNLAQITVDAKGRITAIGEIAFSGSAHVIQDEGTPLANRANLNFAGAGVTATDDAGNNATLVTIPGGAGIGGSTGATDNAVLRADGAGGGTVQNSLATINDSGTVNIPTGQEYQINNAQHTHVEADLVLSDITTDDATTAAHGFLPKLPGTASQYLGGDGSFHDIPTTISCFLDNTASDIGGYKTLVTAIPTAGEASASASITGSATVVEEFALAANQFDFISAQVLHAHIHAEKTAGTKGVNAFVRIYHRTSGGTETLLGTSSNTGTITSKAEYNLDISVGDTIFSNTDRFVVKFLGNPTGLGTDPTLVIYYQGTTASRVEIGASLIAAAGGVTRSGATTDGHLAVWNGSSADSIKDGGAVPSPGSASDFLVVQVFS